MNNLEWNPDLEDDYSIMDELAKLLMKRKPGGTLNISGDIVEYNSMKFKCVNGTTNVTKGINTTKADYWAVRANDKWSICPVTVLKQYCREYPNTKHKVMPYKEYVFLCEIQMNYNGVTING